jgi:hypothetical protein
MKKCRQCTDRTEDDSELCAACAVELAHRILAATPNPEKMTCGVCRAPFGFTEARVLRFAKNPKAGNRATPRLCWVCAHLHLSAQRDAPICALE